MLRDKSVTGGIAMLEGAGTGYEGLQDCLMHKGPDLRGFNARELFVVSDDSDGAFRSCTYELKRIIQILVSEIIP